MPQYAYIIIAIALIIVLAATFFVSFILYRRTPAPKGCEDVKADPEMCPNCQKTNCPFFEEFHKEDKGEK